MGANIREAFYAHGRADFVAKLQIALKECSESEYWIELLLESGYYDDPAILDQCIEIKKLLIASVNTAKSKMKNK
ncbi:MAG: four helix bundle protein [Oscillospiraceae bacterium]